MTGNDPTFALIYTSKLLGDTAEVAVAGIAEVARRNNARDGITGILVFDGTLFAQWLEGDPERLNALLERIRRDPRHTQIQIHRFTQAMDRRFKDWRLGFFLPSSSEQGLFQLRRLEGEAATDAFTRLLPEVDWI